MTQTHRQIDRGEERKGKGVMGFCFCFWRRKRGGDGFSSTTIRTEEDGESDRIVGTRVDEARVSAATDELRDLVSKVELDGQVQEGFVLLAKGVDGDIVVGKEKVHDRKLTVLKGNMKGCVLCDGIFFISSKIRNLCNDLGHLADGTTTGCCNEACDHSWVTGSLLLGSLGSSDLVGYRVTPRQSWSLASMFVIPKQTRLCFSQWLLAATARV